MSNTSAKVRQLAKPLVSRRRGDLVALHITERGRPLVVWCPDDELFTLSRELVLDRIYERGSIGFRPGMGTVVDAGAHVGLFSVQASQWADRVVALEASALNFGVLSLNVEHNALTNVEPHHVALWSTSTDALPFSGTFHSGGGTVTDGARPQGDHVDLVKAVSLDDLLTELGSIDLLKIDIEGAEFEVLNACTKLERISQIVGEIHLEDHESRAQLDRLLPRLEDAGFSVNLVPEAELLSRDRLKRLWANRHALQGEHLVKVLAAAYTLAPVQKPIRSAEATYELPILLAQRR